ncbi:MAG: hypothetical protein QXS05_07510 [Candidatus Bathyarchaeia archaeon]
MRSNYERYVLVFDCGSINIRAVAVDLMATYKRFQVFLIILVNNLAANKAIGFGILRIFGARYVLRFRSCRAEKR